MGCHGLSDNQSPLTHQNKRAYLLLPPNRTLTTGWVVFWTEEGEREADNHVDKLPCHRRRRSHFHFQSTILTTTQNVPLPSPDTLSMNAGQMKGWVFLQIEYEAFPGEVSHWLVDTFSAKCCYLKTFWFKTQIQCGNSNLGKLFQSISLIQSYQ